MSDLYKRVKTQTDEEIKIASKNLDEKNALFKLVENYPNQLMKHVKNELELNTTAIRDAVRSELNSHIQKVTTLSQEQSDELRKKQDELKELEYTLQKEVQGREYEERKRVEFKECLIAIQEYIDKVAFR